MPPEICLILVLTFFFPAFVWAFLRPFFLKASQTEILERQLFRFKYDSDIFHQMLAIRPKYEIDRGMKPIQLGNINSKDVLTVVSDPFCRPCKSAHKIIEDLYGGREDLLVQIVFFILDNDDEMKLNFIKHLLSLDKYEDKDKVRKAFSDWYLDKYSSVDEWMKNNPICNEDNGQFDSILDKQKEWSKISRINFTPTILINGHKLPDQYQLEDIQYLL